MNNPCEDCFANGCCHNKGVCGSYQEYLYFKKRHNCLNCIRYNRDNNTCTKLNIEIFPDINYSQEYTCFEGDKT